MKLIIGALAGAVIGILLTWMLRETPIMLENKDRGEYPQIIHDLPLPRAHSNDLYRFQFTATGEPPIHWKAICPWWCSLSPSGVLRLWWPFWQTKPITITVFSENKYGRMEESYSLSLTPKEKCK